MTILLPSRVIGTLAGPPATPPPPPPSPTTTMLLLPRVEDDVEMAIAVGRNSEKCTHYAGFMEHLDRKHFDALYWTLFFLVLFSLFIVSWIYQWTMRFRDKPYVDDGTVRKRLKVALALCAAIFLVTAVFLVIEVYALLALQFCDGEDIMSLYWSTWTMLQLGTEMAILGVVLTLWHSIVEIRHPMWALALGTPVLVVAGFGHVIQYFCELCWKRAKHSRRNSNDSNNRRLNNHERDPSYSTAQSTSGEKEDPVSSSDTSIKPGQELVEDRLRRESMLGSQAQAQGAEAVYLTVDVGGDERVRAWPSFMGTSPDGMAVIRFTRAPQAGWGRGLESARSPGPATTRPSGS